MNRREALWRLLFPPKCPFCGRVLDEPGVCPKCPKTLPWVEEGPRVLPGGAVCAAPLWYQGEVREAVLRFKFRSAADAAVPLGELLARCAAEHFAGDFDTVVWVPVSRRRLRQRGYDQARLLAEEACRVWGVQARELLRRTVHTPPQSSLRDAAARRANVLGVFGALPDAAGRRVLLIDDVCTSGATLCECVRVLRGAGAACAACAVVARAPKEAAGKMGNL